MGDAGLGVDAALHVFAGVGIAAEAVFGREDCCDVDAFAQHDVEHVLVANHAGVVAQKRYALAFQQRDVFTCLLCADTDCRLCRQGAHCNRQDCQDD